MSAAQVDQVQSFAVTVPAGTAQANPLIVPTRLLDGFDVEWVELRWPPGPRGQVGLYVASSGTQILPFRTGATPNWLIEDGQLVRYDVDTGIDSGDWSVVAYNVGNYPHTVFVRFGIKAVPDPPRNLTGLQLIPAGSLSSSLTGA